MSLAQNIHKSSQILFPHVACPEHSQIFTNLISTRLLPRTFTNVHKSYFHMSLAQNIHKCSQMFTNLIFKCLLPRTFTNVHIVYFHALFPPQHSQNSIIACQKLAQNAITIDLQSINSRQYLPTIFADVHEIEEFDKHLVHKFRTVRFQSTLSSMIYNITMPVESIMRNRNSIKCGNDSKAVNSSYSATFSTAGPAFLSGPCNGNGTTAHMMCIAPTVFQDSLFCIYKYL